MEQFVLKQVSFTYPGANRTSLSNIDLTIQDGEFITICGESGSGKTTLVRHLKSTLTPHGKLLGDIFYRGKKITELSIREQAEKIGFVMQDPDSQIVTDKVWHELAFGLENLGYNQKVMRLRVGEMAEYFGITSWFLKSVEELSGGQKQLLNLASVMVMQPEILILDEPTSQLDPIAAQEFIQTLKKINQDFGTTIVMTEHRLEEIVPISDRIIVMKQGSIAYDKSPRDIGMCLKQNEEPMFRAMPSTIQIFCEAEGQGVCPINIRQGRDWLSKQFRTFCIESNGQDNVEEEWKKVIELRDVWFRYEKESQDILKGTTIDIPQGRLSVIMGGNGAGKSTLLKTICGIVKPYRGKVYIKGKQISKYKSNELYGNCISMLPQDPKSLFVKKTVREELFEMVIDVEKSKDKIDEVIRQVEIEELLDRHPYDLSGGEQQRVALGKLLLKSPEILLLDEPTKGIDCFFKEKLASILKRLIKENGISILMVSHDIEFCARFADYVSLFFNGDILTTNTPKIFFAQNNFYTTHANRMSRHMITGAITIEDVIRYCNHADRVDLL